MVAAQDIDLPIPEARALATQAALGGDPETARRIAAGLLQADPNDRAALLVLAAVEPQLGRPAQGRLAGARAFAVSTTDAEKYEAARLTALAAANEGRFTLAQWWLRRALTVAPTPADEAQTTADARGVRNLNPWSSNVELSFAPSGNVNGGAEQGVYGVPGSVFVEIIPPDEQALSGWAGTLDMNVRYRLAASETFQTTVSARAFGRGILLSDGAKSFLQEEGSSAVAGDYASALLEFGIQFDSLASLGTYGLGANLGQAWEGSDFSYTYLRLDGSRQFPLSENVSAAFFASLEQRWDEDDDVSDFRRSIRTNLNYQQENGNVLTLSLNAERVDGPSKTDTTRSQTAQIGYSLAKPIGPAQVQLSIGLLSKDYPELLFSLYTDDTRSDLRYFVSVNLFFSEFDYAGFAPTVTLSASHTESNHDRYDGEAISINFGFRSTF